MQENLFFLYFKGLFRQFRPVSAQIDPEPGIPEFKFEVQQKMNK